MWRPLRRADAATRAARIVTVAATILFAFALCEWRPWELFIRGGFSADFYDEQARSFLRLRLAVRPEVAGNEGFLIDGRTYLYYGPFLALVRLPFAVFGDVFAGRLTRLSMVIGFASLCTAAFHLVRMRTSSSWRTAGFVAAVACSPALALAGWTSVYHETELWAAVFALWAVVGMLRLLDEPGSRRHALLAGGAITAAILTRAPIGVGIAMGCGVLALALWRRSPRSAGIVVAGCVIGFVGHVTVNLLRFGSLFGLPAERQVLSLQDPTRMAWFAGNHNSFFSTRFLPTTIVQYLRPDTLSLERLVPFVRYGPLAVDRGSYPVETITPTASLPAAATLLFVAALVGVVLIVGRREWRWLVLTGGATVAALPTFLIGFLANRYLVDMLPALAIPAAVAFGSLHLRTAPLRRAARIGVVALVVWGAWANTSLAVWQYGLKQPGFTELRYRVDGWIFGRPSPALLAIAPDAAVPRDGVVGIVADDATGTCSAVYIAEQGRWAPLERSEGDRQLTGELDLSSGQATDVVGGADWTITATPTADGLVVSVDGVPGSEGELSGEPVDLGGATSARVRVVSDPTSHELSVTVDGRTALFNFTAAPLPMTPFETFSTELAETGRLCRQLDARR